jgi:hypothetical protein
LILRYGLLEAVGLVLRDVLGKGNCEVLNSSLEFKSVESLIKGLENILKGLRTDLIDLVQTLYSVLDDFCD